MPILPIVNMAFLIRALYDAPHREKIMRRISFMVAVLLLAGCEMQNGIAHFKPPPILADQSWQVTGEGRLPSGSRICTVGAGGMLVAQWMHGDTVASQVTLDRRLAPGERYKIIFGDHVYETVTGKFRAADSAAIITQLKTSPVTYTELDVLRTRFAGSHVDRMQNIIPRDDFITAYRRCTRFVKRG